MAHIGKLPTFQRYVTGHNSEGKAIVSSDVDSSPPWQTNIEGGRAAFCQAYITSSFPVDFNGEKDVETYKGFLKDPPGLVNSNGTVLRIVDMGPGVTSPMHRTVSLDYGVVLVGEVELQLDSGETRLMKTGDICVQRGTNHAWRNASQTEWARMMYVLQPSKPIEINGKPLGEDLSTMEGVKSSS
ncbi:hypothetical protein BDZ85DRAFT_244416 [Elsinoe ampelina]|uniref:Cupin type-2 domain-containing protein n=1 Tax=Elsinoe ampelina TaxID=302913 RepID=A0A6A6FZQ0_9PEZI|nr:hypothetical protein BDZ85DRAFT_244416 [Elsinoe ampelina]